MSAFDNVEVLEEFIVFEFEQDTDSANRNAFIEKSDGGIILKSSYDESTKLPRWGVVKAVGPKVREPIVVGTKILIEPLKWTKISTYKGEKFARTEQQYVMAIED